MTHAFDHGKNMQAITFDALFRAHMPGENTLDMFSVNMVKDFHLCEGEGIVMCRGHDKNRDFSCPPPPLVTAFTGSAVEKGIINLDQSGIW
jgi:hypothetical protein